MVAADRQAEDLTNAAASDGADNGGGAHVDLGAQQRVGDEIGQDLRHHGEADALHPACTGRLQALVRLHVGILRSEEHTSELQSLMRISYAVFCLKKKKQYNTTLQ